MGYKRGLSKFSPVPKPRILIDTVGGTCATCKKPIAAGSRVLVSYVRERSPDAWTTTVVEHEACATERAS